MQIISHDIANPANNYLRKVNNKNTRKKDEIWYTNKTPERRHWGRSGGFIVNFEHISKLFSVCILFTMNK